MNKFGVSAVIATVLLIALTLGLVAIVWTTVNSLVQKNIESSESCFNVLNKVTLNQKYTCYNNTAVAGEDEVWFSINVGDIEKVDDILVAISGSESSVSFRMLGDSPQELSNYPDRTQPVAIPGKDSGRTYIYRLPDSFSQTQTPEKIEIALVIDGEVCGNIDSINQFDSCSLLAS